MSNWPEKKIPQRQRVSAEEEAELGMIARKKFNEEQAKLREQEKPEQIENEKPTDTLF